MLWAIASIIMILWVLGIVTGYTIGGGIHTLIVAAAVVVLFRLIYGPRPKPIYEPPMWN